MLRWLAPVGRFSLEVFCLGLFLSWIATTVLRFVPWSPVLDVLLIGSGCAILALFARWLERRRGVRRVVAVA